MKIYRRVFALLLPCCNLMVEATEPLLPSVFSYQFDENQTTDPSGWRNLEEADDEGSYSYSWEETTQFPTQAPTLYPTHAPTHPPTRTPSRLPSWRPSHVPTKIPTPLPTPPEPSRNPTLSPTSAETIGATVSLTFIASQAPTEQDRDAILQAIEANILSLFGATAKVRDMALSMGAGRRQLLAVSWFATFRVTVLQSAVRAKLGGGGGAEVASQIATSLAEPSFADAVVSTTSSGTSVDPASIAAQSSARVPVTHSPSLHPTPSSVAVPAPVDEEDADLDHSQGSQSGGGDVNSASGSAVLLGVLIPVLVIALACAGYFARAKFSGNAGAGKAKIPLSNEDTSSGELDMDMEARGSPMNPLGYDSGSDDEESDSPVEASTSLSSSGNRRPFQRKSRNEAEEDEVGFSSSSSSPVEESSWDPLAGVTPPGAKEHDDGGDRGNSRGARADARSDGNDGGSLRGGRFEEASFLESPVNMHAACFKEQHDLLPMPPPLPVLPHLPEVSPGPSLPQQTQIQEANLLSDYAETI